MKRASLNHVYRTIWSQVLRTWVVVAENVRGRGKSRSCKLVVAGLSLAVGTAAQAMPTGGQVVAGAGNISQSGAVTTVTQTSQNMSANWQGFNVASSETVNFVQPTASAIAVNRIFDTNGTQILGHLNANGQVYLINPNGILFGPGAQVNVGGLVASTLDLNDASLNSAARTFSGNGMGSVINQGTINGAYVALLGKHVSNQGTITSPQGAVALGAGSAATLTFSGSSLVHMQVDQSVLDSQAENGGLIRADGGMVVMAAGARDALLASVVNNAGVIEAHSVENHDGSITLQGGAAAGTTRVSGTLDASNSSGKGGAVTVLGNNVQLAPSAQIDVSGATGGGVTYVGGGARGEDPSMSNAANTTVDAGAAIHADATQHGDGGNIVLWGDTLSTAATLTARGGVQGGNGGLVETSGHLIDIAGSNVQTASPMGAGGTWLLDPLNVTIGTAATTGVTSNPNPGGGTTSPNTTTSQVKASDIVAALNAGNSVVVKTTGTTGAQTGSITVTAPIAMTATPASTPTLTLDAAGSINVTAAITSTGSAMNLTMNAAGATVIGQTIDTNGGAVSITSNTTSGHGIDILSGAGIKGGSVSLIGTTSGSGTGITGVHIQGPIEATAGNVVLTGTATGAATWGINVGGSITATGSVTLTGNSSSSTGVIDNNLLNTYAVKGDSVVVNGNVGAGSIAAGVRLTNITATGTGGVTINGDSAAVSGVQVDNISSPNGAIKITGKTSSASTSAAGVETGSAGATISGKSVDILGTATDAGIGVSLSAAANSTITATGGTLNIKGINNSSTGTTSQAGVLLQKTTTLSSTAGTTLTGEMGSTQTSGGAVRSYGNATLVLNGAGDTLLTDDATSGTSIGVLNGGTITNNGTGDLTFTSLKNNVSNTGSISNGANDLVMAAGTTYAANTNFAAAGEVVSSGAITNSGAAKVTVYSGSYTMGTTTVQNGKTNFNSTINGVKPYLNAGSGWYRYNTAYADAPSATGTIGDGKNYIMFRQQPTATLTAGSTTKVYGTADPTAPTFAVTGNKNQDTGTQIAGGGTLTRANAGTIAGENVGTYDYSGGLSQIGYALNFSGTPKLTITPAPLTVTPNDGQSKVYGQLDPTLTYGLAGLISTTVDGVTLNDTAAGVLGGALSRTAGNNVGSYAINQGSLALTSTGAGTGSNYTLVFTAGKNFAITPAVLTLTAAPSTKTFDGNTVAAATPTVTGLVGSDTVTGASEVYDTQNVGTGKTLTVGAGYTINDGNGGNNYTVNIVNSTNGTITPAILTITATSNTKVYDGNNVATATPTVSGLVGSDTVTGVTEVYADKNAGTGKTLTVNGGYTINDGNGGNNYAVNIVNSTTGVITPAVLTITATPNSSKAYDGTIAAAGAPGVAGLVGSDSISGVTQVYDNRNAGTGKALTIGRGYVISDGNGGNNYTVDVVNSMTGAITPVALTITVSPSTKVYDGTTAATGTPTVAGLVGGDTVSGLAAAYDNQNVGSGKTMTLGSYVINDGNGGSNYTVTTLGNNAGVITPATLTYTAAPVRLSTGDAPAGLSGKLSGFAAGETQDTATSGALSWITPATSASPVGRYAINGSGLSAGNYVFVQNPSNATALTLIDTSIVLDLSDLLNLAANTQPRFDPSTAITKVDEIMGLPAVLTPTGTFATNEGNRDDAFLYGADDRVVIDSVKHLRTNGPKLEVINGGIKMPGDIVAAVTGK